MSQQPDFILQGAAFRARNREALIRSKALVAENRARRSPSPPSRPTPGKHRRLNLADMIEEQMQKDGHRTWGFVIYRTTYTSDSDWTDFVVRLQAVMKEEFDQCNGNDVLDRFSLTIMDDKETFDGMSSHDIRQHFHRWALDNYDVEQPQAHKSGKEAVDTRRYPRYCLAVQVDAESLHSVVHCGLPSPEVECNDKAWVKVINKPWTPEADRDEDEDGDDDDEEEDSVDEPYEPIEGVSQRDVGWMKVPLFSVMTDYYQYSADSNYWARIYQRPSPPPPDVQKPIEPQAYDWEAEKKANAEHMAKMRSRIQSPSRRTPNRSRHFNTADQIEMRMRSDSHEVWGFIIYRTAYDSDIDWSEALLRLRHHYETVFRYCNGQDILSQFRLTVMNDKAQFDGASTDDIRRHFQRWSIANYKLEQPQPQEPWNPLIRIGNSPRYRFALQIDGESLHSIIHDAPAPPGIDIDKKS